MKRSLLALVPLLGLGLAGCGDQPEAVVVADDGESERIQQLNRKVQELEAELRANVVGTREAEELRNRVGDMERDIRDLKEMLEAAPAGATAPSGTTPAGDGSTSAEPSRETFVPPTPAGGPEGTFNEEQIASFRKLQEEVDRRKDAEQRAERVKRQLTRAGVTLTDEEQKAVIDRTIAHENEVRTLMRGGFGRTDEERAEVQTKIADLRNVFERDLRSIVRSDSADKVVEALGRANPGILRRAVERTDRTTRPR